jgi:hypothetical protein
MEIALPVYDDEGNQVDTTTVELNQDQIQDIVNTAAQLVYADRKWDGGENADGIDVQILLGELDEALTSYSVIEDPEED